MIRNAEMKVEISGRRNVGRKNDCHATARMHEREIGRLRTKKCGKSRTTDLAGNLYKTFFNTEAERKTIDMKF